MLGLLTAIAVQTTSAQPQVATLGEVRTWSKFEAADRLLPVDIAEKIVDGRFQTGGPPGLYSGFWWASAERTRAGFCHRSAYYASVRVQDYANLSAASPMQSDVKVFTQYAPINQNTPSAERCAVLTGWVSTTREDEESKLETLRRLVEAMDLAANRRPLPFEISIECDSGTSGRCPEARAALRDLPMKALYDVRLSSGRYRTEPARNSVQVRYALLPPDGVYAKAEVAFGPAQDASSWFVTLEGRDQIQRITLRRASVVYH